jgi:hypothetical protein
MLQQEDIFVNSPVRLDRVSLWTPTANIRFQDDDRPEVSVETRFTERITAESPLFLPALRDFIRFSFGSIPDVLAVFVSVHDRLCHVWTMVEKSSPETRKQVYEKEKVLIGQFNQVDFDFNVMASASQESQKLSPDPAATLTFMRVSSDKYR